ncbi:YdcF family protein [Corynebacterium sp. UMB6689]|uniref:YdcF family protein n=1 Tax=Corynebacterium sp. UMB6689 TaxID=3046341 RepID=UPI00254C6D1A|nr:YdcF family protein [Corynebacterium sp. UMB6689]MDK6814019.1 YdcF family protein [Corynebacterium sp. UMB6689]
MKYVIVLGAAQYDGRPSRILSGRVRFAAEYAAAHDLPIITVGGKLPGDRFTEAGVAKRLLDDEPLTVTALEEGLDTRSELAAAHTKLGVREAVIITDPLHRLRTFLIARQEGIQATVLGTPYYPSPRFSIPWWRYLAHELGGLAYLGLRTLLGEKRTAGVRTAFYRIERLIRPNQALRHQVIGARQTQEGRDSA